jgi:surfeit locus 1 family protein
MRYGMVSMSYGTDTAVDPDYSTLLDMEAKGIPIGRAPEVNLRNNHAQYIFTW